MLDKRLQVGTSVPRVGASVPRVRAGVPRGVADRQKITVQQTVWESFRGLHLACWKWISIHRTWKRAQQKGAPDKARLNRKVWKRHC